MSGKIELIDYIEQFRQRFNLNDDDHREMAKDLCQVVLDSKREIKQIFEEMISRTKERSGIEDVKGSTPANFNYTSAQGMNLNNNRFFRVHLNIEYEGTLVEEISVQEYSEEEYKKNLKN